MEKIESSQRSSNQCDGFNLQRRFIGSYSLFFADIVFILVGCKVLHIGLRKLGQPRIVSHIIMGLLVGFLQTKVGVVFDSALPRLLHTISTFGIMSYMFVLGLEMDPRSIPRRPNLVSTIAYMGIISTIIIVVSMQKFLNDERLKLFIHPGLKQVLALAFVVANTASPILTRLITELKIGKSEIGRVVMRAGVFSDMISMILNAMGPALNSDMWLVIVIFIIIQWVFTVKVVARFVNWVNERNPEGKPMRTLHLLMTLAYVMLMCFLSTWMAYNGTMNAFLVGLAFPREGRLTRHLVHKINMALGTIVFPLFFCWVGIEANSKERVVWNKDPSPMVSFTKFLIMVFVGTVGKVSGTLLATTRMGFPLPEGIAIGLLMHIKGHFHIFCATMARGDEIISKRTFVIMILANTFTILYIPLVVRMILRRARQREANLQLGLQWHDPTSDLRMIVCLQGPHNVPAAINIIEATRGGPESGALTVYAMDMVELTSRAAATLTHADGTDAVTVMDESVVEMREQITVAFEAYEQESGDGLMVRRAVAISKYENMHEDVCNSATDALAALVVMPFHKRQRVDGAMDETYPRFRQVNQRVLAHSPCSVGILVDRGLGAIKPSSAAFMTHHVAVIFIGGCDDREVLHLATRMAYCPSIKLTAIRFLPDPGAHSSSIGGSSRTLTDMEDDERDIEVDKKCLADFYKRHVENGRVGYVEKCMMDGAETVATLKMLEELYSLFIVGRGGKDKSKLTSGMSDWEENPELGPIGDILAASDFSQTASVLIIQQYNPNRRKQEENWEDEFSVM